MKNLNEEVKKIKNFWIKTNEAAFESISISTFATWCIKFGWYIDVKSLGQNRNSCISGKNNSWISSKI